VTRIDVACAAEGSRYIAHSAAMLHSVIAAHPDDDVQIHYLHGPEFPRVARDRIAAWVRGLGAAIGFNLVPDDRLAGVPTRGFTRKATWYRVFLPELLPGCDRVLYLDSDLIVLDDLAPLFDDVDMGGHQIGAVTNVFQHNDAGRPAELGLPSADVYFNAGVLLMNLAAMREDRSSRALISYARENSELIAFRDQDALNVVLGERRRELHPRWNCMNSLFVFDHAADVFGREALEEARSNPAIRHFEGPSINKPWHYLCDREGRELYDRHRAQTPWPRVRREGVTPRNVARRLLGASRGG
jgi:lipopolysaccharide biosynthesis glycosyltransferase